MESNHINIAHINARSITVVNESGARLDHINEFLIKDLNCDIIACTETHLSCAIDDHEVDLDNFSIVRRDRNRHGGGVLIYIRNNINYARLADFESPNSEMIWVEIKNGSKEILLGACYRPPGQNANEIKTFLDDLEHALFLADRRKGAMIILMGDFNDPCLNFEASHDLSQIKYELYNLSKAHGLAQLIKEPTTEKFGMHCRVIFRPSQLFLLSEELSNTIFSCLLILAVGHLVASRHPNVSRFVLRHHLLPSC